MKNAKAKQKAVLNLLRGFSWELIQVEVFYLETAIGKILGLPGRVHLTTNESARELSIVIVESLVPLKMGRWIFEDI